MITSSELRQKYLDFFAKKGHAIIPSASLIPENDPSTLFISAGMQPLVPYLLGEKHPDGQRLVNSQKCIRTGDIDEVGDETHHTFFEMLGHWSLGDYFKKEAMEMSYEFLTKELKLEPKRLAFSVFAGDKNAPKDQTAADAWKNLGVPAKRIAYLPKKDNWWEPAGSSGPCGPCTEMFYWSDNSTEAPEKFDPSDKRWVEIGNDVLMEYEKTSESKYKPADQKNIDNGTGLERTLAVLNGTSDDYQTDLFLPIINKIEELSGKKYGDDEKINRSMRIIADHLRAATFIMGDEKGIQPSNLDQGYIIRRLIRRAIRYGKELGINKSFTFQVAETIIKLMGEIYPELKKNKDFIVEQLVQEEEKFEKAIQEGLKAAKKIFAPKKSISREKFVKLMQTKGKDQILHQVFEKRRQKKPYDLNQFGISKKDFDEAVISGKESFYLYQSFGFPIEMILELAREKNLFISKRGFSNEVQKHQELSRTATAGKFKGGLADHSEIATKYHTATHLLLAALRQVLGDHVYQKGSNITAERLRFDFSHPEKLTDEQKEKVERLVNQAIQDNLPVTIQEMSLDDAKKLKAMGIFAAKYGEKVKVYTIGNPHNPFSREICGGPHVEKTEILGQFKIKKEEASSSGVRRIKAVLS
nr:hypothetical protein [uncultured bacterium]